jgi:uncharacterized SAM-binding protein YcdF (DUF218 family)
MLIIGKIVQALIFPPGLFALLLLLVALLAFRGRRRAAAICAAGAALILYVFSMGAFVNILLSPLENRYAPITEPGGARYVVVLGGGFVESSPERGGGPSLAPVSTVRAAYGLELSRRFGLPLVYSGGRGYASRVAATEAEAAKAFWLSLGAGAGSILLEDASQDTKENAAGIARIVGASRIVVVTSAAHMPRSMLALARAGIDAVPAPTDYEAKRSPLTWADFMPDLDALKQARAALHEYLGLLYYRMTL